MKSGVHTDTGVIEKKNMDAVTSQRTTNTLRYWRQNDDNVDNNNDVNDLGMSLPLGLNNNRSKMTSERRPYVPLSRDEVYELENDTSLDKGYTVWRSLPMESDLDKKIKSSQALNRSANFTKFARPEAYLPGYTGRPGGPISRPRNAAVTSHRVKAKAAQQTTQQTAAVASKPKPAAVASTHGTDVSDRRRRESQPFDAAARQRSDVSTDSNHGNARQAPSGVLQDNIIRKPKN